MKPARFDYLAAASIDEALDALARFGPDARVLAGGQSLVRLMNSRLAKPALVVDINRIPGLDGLNQVDSSVRIGALVRQRTSEMSSVIRERLPVLAEAGAEVAHVPIRERGTVVGSLAFADPCAELPTAFLALEGIVTARSVAAGTREIAADDFFLGPYRTALREDELATEVRIPLPPAGRTGSAFLEVTRRHGELPMCGVAAVVQLDPDDRIGIARISIGAIGDRPLRASEAEQFLLGRPADTEALTEASRVAASSMQPVGTVHGSADYRRHLTAVVTRRCLELAVERAHQGDPAHV